jgi:hypothetical protein
MRPFAITMDHTTLRPYIIHILYHFTSQELKRTTILLKQQLQMSNPQREQDQFKVLKSRANVKKEGEKEGFYKNLFLDLMKKHKDTLFNFSIPHNANDYNKERLIIKKVMEIERESIVGALAVGVTAFLTVRYFPRFAVRMIGGDAKIRAMEEAEAKQTFLKAAGSLLFESTVGIWSAYRGYHLAASMRSGNIYEDVVNLPLCEGRSIVADTICNEWQDIIRYKIAPEFWENLNSTQSEEGEQIKLKNPEFFKGVLEFNQACRKRKAFEDMIRKREGKKSDEPIIIPSPGVPNNILELTDEEVDALLN